MIEIPKTHNNFKAIYKTAVTCKKTPKYEKRGHIIYLHVIDGYMYHTNGRYLISVKIDIKDGVYEIKSANRTSVILQKVDGDFNFPDVSVLTNIDYTEAITFKGFKTQLTAQVALACNILLDSDFVCLAWDIVEVNSKINVSWVDDKSPVKFSSELNKDVSLYLMPVRK